MVFCQEKFHVNIYDQDVKSLILQGSQSPDAWCLIPVAYSGPNDQQH